MNSLVFKPDTHEYFYNGLRLPSVTQVLTDMGFINTDFYNEDGRRRGKFVHLATELDDKGELDDESLDSALLPYVEAWRSFKRDTGFKVESIEKQVASTIYNFAGTIDRIGIIDGMPCIPDIKSGSVEPWCALQLAGYEIAENKRYKRFAVQLMETGKYKVHPFTSPQDRPIFLAAVSCWHWINNHRKGDNHG